MNDLEQAQELTRAAEKDISALRGMGDAATFADEIFGFHVQQAAGKLFKARLASSRPQSGPAWRTSTGSAPGSHSVFHGTGNRCNAVQVSVAATGSSHRSPGHATS